MYILKWDAHIINYVNENYLMAPTNFKDLTKNVFKKINLKAIFYNVTFVQRKDLIKSTCFHIKAICTGNKLHLMKIIEYYL